MSFYSDRYCHDCERWFASWDALHSHLMNNSSHAYCHPCQRAFVDYEARQQHYESNSAHLDTYCSFCEENFDDEQGLAYHFRTASVHKDSFCHRCNLGFAWKFELTAHKKNTPDKHVLCATCGDDFSTKAERHEHWRTAAAHKHTYCKICSINCYDSSALKVHLRSNPNKHHLCVSCNTRFSDRPGLVQHWTTNKKHKDLYCQQCDVHFDNTAAKKAHQVKESVKHNFCVPCSLEYRSRGELVNHWTFSVQHEKLYDSRCDTHFDSPIARWSHQQATPEKHNLCELCRLDFHDKNALTTHWKNDEVHKGTYDENCSRLFDSPMAMQKHIRETPSKHKLCETCQVDFVSLELLQKHWKSSLAHIDTYCEKCQQKFLDPHKLQEHMQERHPRRWCERCCELFPTRELLKDHWTTSAAHGDSRCSTCSEGFMIPADLKKHSFTHRKTALRCLCCNDENYTTYSAMFTHLESGDCSSGNDMQVLNALVSECRGAEALTIQGREPFLRAGAPRDIPHKSDLNPKKNTWKCPYCKRSENLLSAADLSRHLQAQKYLSGYPDVLQCSGCKVTFNKLSALCAHLESKSCSESMGSGPPAALLEYLSAEFSKPDTKERLSELTYGLRTDPSQAGLLYVKVTQNIRSSSERVPPT